MDARNTPNSPKGDLFPTPRPFSMEPWRATEGYCSGKGRSRNRLNNNSNVNPNVDSADDLNNDLGSSSRNDNRYRPTYDMRYPASVSPRAIEMLSPFKVLAVMAAVLIIVMLIVNIVLSAQSATVQPFSRGGASENPPSSTTRSLWVKGVVPELYQTDPEWANTPYADGTIATHGCGPTCLSMAYVALTGKRDMDPAGMAAFSEREGYIDSGVTSWLLMSEGAFNLGLNSSEIPADANKVLTELEAGHPIICSVGPGDFTNEGHFIVLARLDDSEGNKVKVCDPNSSERTHMTWEINRVLAQCRNLWALSI